MDIGVIEEYACLPFCGHLWNPILDELLSMQDSLSLGASRKRFKSNSDVNLHEEEEEDEVDPSQLDADQFQDILDYLFQLWYDNCHLYVETMDQLTIWRSLKSNSHETGPSQMKDQITRLSTNSANLKTYISHLHSLPPIPSETKISEEGGSLSSFTSLIHDSWMAWANILSITDPYNIDFKPLPNALYYCCISYYLFFISKFPNTSLENENENENILTPDKSLPFPILPFSNIDSLICNVPISQYQSFPFFPLLIRLSQTTSLDQEYESHFSKLAYSLYHFPSKSIHSIDTDFAAAYDQFLSAKASGNTESTQNFANILKAHVSHNSRSKLQKKILIQNIRSMLQEIDTQSDDDSGTNPSKESTNKNVQIGKKWSSLIFDTHFTIWPDTELTGLLYFWSFQMAHRLSIPKTPLPWTTDFVFSKFTHFPKVARWILNGKRFHQALSSKYWIQTFLSIGTRAKQQFLAEWLIDYVIWQPNIEPFLWWEWAHGHFQILQEIQKDKKSAKKSAKKPLDTTQKKTVKGEKPGKPGKPKKTHSKRNVSGISETITVSETDVNNINPFGIMSLFGSFSAPVIEESVDHLPKQTKKVKNTKKGKHKSVGNSDTTLLKEEEEDDTSDTTPTASSSNKSKKQVKNTKPPSTPVSGVLFVKGLAPRTTKLDVSNLLVKKLSSPESINPYLSGDMLLDTIGVNEIVFLDGQDFSSPTAKRGSCFISFNTHQLAVEALSKIRGAKMVPLFYNGKVNTKLQAFLCKKPSSHPLHNRFHNTC